MTGEFLLFLKVLGEFTAKKGMCPVSVFMAVVEALARTEHYSVIPEVSSGSVYMIQYNTLFNVVNTLSENAIS